MTLAGTGWAISLLLYTNKPRKMYGHVRTHLEKDLGWVVCLLLYTNGIAEKTVYCIL